jgi:hypothetical protein
MANLYVTSTGSNTAPYETWAKAATTLGTAVSAASAGDTIFAHQETEVIATSTTYTLLAGVNVIGSNDTANAPPQTAGIRTIDGSATGNVTITINGNGSLVGLTLKSGTSTANVVISSTADDEITAENCTFDISAANATSGGILIGRNNVISSAALKTRGCSFVWGGTGQGFAIYGPCESVNDDFSAGATHPATLFEIVSTAARVSIYGGDLSDITGTIFEASPITAFYGEIVNSKLGSGVTVYSPTTDGAGEVYVRDSNSGDTHYDLAHYTFQGSTTISTSIYLTSNNTGNRSWVVSSSANATFLKPYASPWINVPHTGTSAITPRLEILRDGSATPYTNGQVWGDFGAKTTASSTRATIVNDRRTIVAAAANQASSSLGAGDWTGENATAWFGKLEPTSTITPAESGHIRARVVIDAASLTVYVHPEILGLS